MVKILIVTHGPLAEGFGESLKMFFGEPKDLECIGFFPNEGTEDLKNKIESQILKYEENSEMLFFVDIFAGSPFNVVAEIIGEYSDRYSIECFSGVSMPLLMECYSMKDSTNLESLTSHVESISKDVVINLKKILFSVE